MELHSSNLNERTGRGQEIYVESMEKSAAAKAKEVLPWVKEGVIVDVGAAAGAFTDILSSKFPESKIVALELSEDMVSKLKKRFEGRKNVEVVKADAKDFLYSEPVNTFINTSVLHEVFTFNGYNHDAVLEILNNQKTNLVEGGRIVVRDGVQPEPEQLYIKPLTQFACDRFLKFVEGFRQVRNVNYKIGNFRMDNVFMQNGRMTFKDNDIGNSLIEISSQNASEMFSKYFYAEENLPVELSEQFGIWTLGEYKKVLSGLGFSVTHSETFLLDYLLNEHYSKDFEIYHLVNGTLSNASYPPSTMLLVGEK